MFESIKFEHKKFIDKAKKIDKKVDLKNFNNAKNMKDLLISPLYAGLVISALVFIPIYYSIMSDNMGFFTGVLVLLLTAILGTIWSLFVLNSRMKCFSYIKLKKIIKDDNYEMLEYIGNIQVIYTSTSINTKSNLDDDLRKNETTTNGRKLIVEDQTFYLSDQVYLQLLFDKQIKLYFIKNNDKCILYDYERILNEKSNKNNCNNKPKVEWYGIVLIVMFILMILIFPILGKLGLM